MLKAVKNDEIQMETNCLFKYLISGAVFHFHNAQQQQKGQKQHLHVHNFNKRMSPKLQDGVDQRGNEGPSFGRARREQDRGAAVDSKVSYGRVRGALQRGGNNTHANSREG